MLEFHITWVLALWGPFYSTAVNQTETSTHTMQPKQPGQPTTLTRQTPAGSREWWDVGGRVGAQRASHPPQGTHPTNPGIGNGYGWQGWGPLGKGRLEATRECKILLAAVIRLSKPSQCGAEGGIDWNAARCRGRSGLPTRASGPKTGISEDHHWGNAPPEFGAWAQARARPRAEPSL